MKGLLLTPQEELYLITEVKSLLLIDKYLNNSKNIFKLSYESILTLSREFGPKYIELVFFYREVIRLGLKEVRHKNKYKEELIQKNQRLVASIAKKYSYRTNLTVEDLIQEGIIGLIESIKRFDVKRGNRLSTYATPWIKQSIRAAITKHRNIKIPPNIYRLNKVTNQIILDLKKRLKREPGDLEIIREGLIKGVNIPREAINEIRNIPNIILSLDSPKSDNSDYDCLLLIDTIKESCPEDNVYNPDNYIEIIDKRESVIKVIRRLPNENNMADIVLMFYGLDGTNKPKSYKKIASLLKMDLEVVRRTYHKALVLLKTKFYVRVIDYA